MSVITSVADVTNGEYVLTSKLACDARWTRLAQGPIVMRMVKTPNWPADRFKALIDRVLGETGLNKAQLASLASMNPSQLSRWTNGSGRPRFESLLVLGKALQARYPNLGVGPGELAAAAGYSTEDTPEEPHSPWGASSSASEAKAPAEESGEVGELDLESYVPQTAVERALLAIYRADQQLIQQQFAELSRKVDRLTVVRDGGEVESEDAASKRRKGA